ncbi:hypothetical protein [Burkholderia diffusa]|uniref:hypothetical protein n=1 Tax=Burkholderia diffusa TaxID=488732 RepID=UPI002AAF9BEA|nr:hypothetical protein [Burkholderia diffusa]
MKSATVAMPFLLGSGSADEPRRRSSCAALPGVAQGMCRAAASGTGGEGRRCGQWQVIRRATMALFAVPTIDDVRDLDARSLDRN